jgi:ribonuclease HI
MTSNETLFILIGNVPIILKAKELANIYWTTKKLKNRQLAHETNYKTWTHPADTVKICHSNDSKDYTIHIYTVGSKHENGVGSGMAIYTDDKLKHHIRYKLHNSCSNNHAEQNSILKALNTLASIKLNQSVPRTAKIHTDSKITLVYLKNPKSRKKLIAEFRKQTATLKREKWEIVFTWINLLKTERRPLHLNPHSVPRCKHFSSRL